MAKKKKEIAKEEMKAEEMKAIVADCKARVKTEVASAARYLFDDADHGGEFYSHILLNMDRIYDDKRVQTAAVSIGKPPSDPESKVKINLYVNPVFFCHTLAEGLSLNKESDKIELRKKQSGVICHEILHCILHHLSRGKDFGNPQLANIAMDLAVNSNLPKAHLSWGEKGKGLFPEDYNLEKDKSLPWYYENFPIEDNPICETPKQCDKNHKKKQDQGDQDGDNKGDQKGQQNPGDQSPGENGNPGDEGEGQEGEGQGGGQGGGQGDGDQEGGSGQGEGEGEGHNHSVGEDGKCKECDGIRPMDDHGIWDEDAGENMSEAMKESMVNKAIGDAAEASSSKSIGSLPNAIQEMIKLAKKKPQVNWRQVVKTFASRLANAELVTTKKKISRRYGTRPGTKLRPKMKLGVSVDVSGSISQEEYLIFMNEIISISKATGSKVEVVEWDSGIQSVYTLGSTAKEVTRSGSGGTDPAEAIKYFDARPHSFDGVIHFTDGYIPPLEKRSRIPSIWVVTADGSLEGLKGKARTIKLPKKESEAA